MSPPCAWTPCHRVSIQQGVGLQFQTPFLWWCPHCCPLRSGACSPQAPTGTSPWHTSGDKGMGNDGPTCGEQSQIHSRSNPLVGFGPESTPGLCQGSHWVTCRHYGARIAPNQGENVYRAEVRGLYAALLCSGGSPRRWWTARSCRCAARTECGIWFCAVCCSPS